MIKALVFDCFGVVYRDAFKEFLYKNSTALSKFLKDKPTLRKIGFPRYYYELAREIDMRQVSDDVFYGTLSDATNISENEIKEFMNMTESMLNEDVVGLIKKLREKYKIVLIANADRQFLQKFLDYKNIKELFDYVLTSSEAKVPKPDLQFFKVIINNIKVNMDEILYIDDSQNDVQIANSFGIAAVQFINLNQLKRDIANKLNN